MNPGNLGHLFIILSFVTSILSCYSYYQHSKDYQDSKWLLFGRISFYIHSITVLSVFLVLFYLINTHQYQYHYVWAHSSNDLDFKFMIACFWEGQEGSFLLWTFWHVIFGLILLNTSGKMESDVMTVFTSVQIFLTSMILGTYFGDFKIGSSPFVLLKDVFPSAPVFANPDFIPQDGNGLNPLLQNYWMVIHPPVLFAGFALTTIPFCFAIASLWRNGRVGDRESGGVGDWVSPALIWSLAGCGILGLGVIMGGYWAYETLNFGGYWNWDPVENSSLVPWLIIAGSVHSLVVYKNTQSSLKTSYLLTITTFLLVLYSTFLTRSGILGNASVHSFTDLGLSGQLLVYFLFYLLLSLFLLVFRFSKIPSIQKEENFLSKEFWMFTGIILLCLSAFQLIVTTSIPVFNKIASLFSTANRLAPPADLITHFSNWQIWFAVFIAFLSGIGQFIWWKKMDRKNLQNILIKPFLLTIIFSILIIYFMRIGNFSYIVLLICSLFSFFANLFVMIQIVKGNVRMMGGALAHSGMALILMGILFSSGYSKIISSNATGKNIFSGSEFTEEQKQKANKENIMLLKNQTVKMDEYDLTYMGLHFEIKNFPSYVPSEDLSSTSFPFRKMLRKDLFYKKRKYFSKGEIVDMIPYNSYYKLHYSNKVKDFFLYPRAQVNPKMGLIASPDIKRMLTKDLYTHVSSIPDFNNNEEWKNDHKYDIRLGDTIALQNCIIIFEEIDKNPLIAGNFNPGKYDIAVGARLKILSMPAINYVTPVYIIKDKMVYSQEDINDETGIKVGFTDINPDKQTIGLEISQRTPFKDYIILKVVEKPMINLLWVGTVVLVVGFFVALVRRVQQN